MTSIYIKVGKRPAGRNAASNPRDRVLAHVRRALLSGETVILPGVGKLSVHHAKGYVLTHPNGEKSRSIQGERKVVFHPERSFLQALNHEATPTAGESSRASAERADAYKNDI